MTDAATTKPPTGRGQAATRRRARTVPVRGATVWEPVRNGWRQIYGSFCDLGVSIESHHFTIPGVFEWSRSFHPESIELCLNLAGHGSIHSEEASMEFELLTAGFYLPGKGTLKGARLPGPQHRFITVEFSLSYLRDRLGGSDGALHPLVEQFVRDGALSAAAVGEVHRLTSEQERRTAQLLCPPVCQGARSLWFQSKILELMAEFFFERRGEEELFCDRQKRLARERVDRVMAILHRRLVEPPALEEIGREVGCSPFYLSRTFSAETGTTIPQYLRKLRMERAAELLRSGKYNVTEAALEVGYSSLSHFSQAFCQTMGCCPGLYPLKATLRGLSEHASRQTIQV